MATKKTFRKGRKSGIKTTSVSSLSRKVSELAREVKREAPEKIYLHSDLTLDTLDSSYDGTPVLTTPTTIAGREHVSKYLTIRGQVEELAGTDFVSEYLRLVVVWDKSPDNYAATLPTFSYDSAIGTDAEKDKGERSPFINYSTNYGSWVKDFHAVRNPNTYGRYKVLMDKTFTCNTINTSRIVNERLTIDEKSIELNNPSSTVTNPIESGQLLVYMVPSTGQDPHFYGTSTYCYTDAD